MKRGTRLHLSKKQVDGFTLLEVLVVMALLSLLMLAMGSALRTTAQTEERIDQKLLRNDEMRVADDFLRDVLGRISVQKRSGPVAAGTNPYVFSANAQELTWIGVMPARFGAGGRYHFRLTVEDQSVERTLVLRYVPWDSKAEPDWGRSGVYTLSTGVVGMDLQYQDAENDPPIWTAKWTSADKFPQRVRLALRTASGPWPDIVVALRLMPGSDPESSGGFAVGGGAR